MTIYVVRRILRTRDTSDQITIEAQSAKSAQDRIDNLNSGQVFYRYIFIGELTAIVEAAKPTIMRHASSLGGGHG